MCGVVVIAQFAEGISAALGRAVIADRNSAVSTFSHGRLAARHTYVAATGYVLDLTERIHVTIAADADLDSFPAFRLQRFSFRKSSA